MVDNAVYVRVRFRSFIFVVGARAECVWLGSRTQDWVTYMSSMLDLGNANVDPAAATNDGIIGAF